jgi:hypothetical protein
MNPFETIKLRITAAIGTVENTIAIDLFFKDLGSTV